MGVETTDSNISNENSSWIQKYLTSLKSVFNLEIIFWGIVSTIGVYYVCDRTAHLQTLNRLLTATWALSYVFCTLVYD